MSLMEGVLTDADVQGHYEWDRSSEFVWIRDLVEDPRPISGITKGHVQNISQNFERDGFDPVPYWIREDGRKQQLGHHHSTRAASELGFLTVPARLVRSVRNEREAAAFQDKEKQKSLRSIDRAALKVRAGDEEYMLVTNVVGKYGLKIVAKSSGNDPYAVSNLDPFCKILVEDGVQTLEDVCDILTSTWEPTDRSTFEGRWNAPLLVALASRLNDSPKPSKVDIRARLRKKTPRDMLLSAKNIRSVSPTKEPIWKIVKAHHLTPKKRKERNSS